MANTLQSQVGDTVRVMRENIVEVSEREKYLSSLQGKTDDIAEQSDGLWRDAKKASKWMCSKYIKSWICLIGGVMILLVVLVIIPVTAWTLRHHS